MNKNFILFGILASILMGGFGLFSINDSFAEDNLSVSREDSEAYKKQLEKEEKEKEKSEERKQKLEEKQEKAKQKDFKKELKEAKEAREKKAEEKQEKAKQKDFKKELKEEKEAREKKAEEKEEKAKQKAEERKQKLEEKKAKLDSDRKKLEEKLSKKINKYEEKLREIKEKYQYKIESDLTGDVDKFSAKIEKYEDKLSKKSEDIRKKLLEKQEKLDSRTQKILDKINDGEYLGDKLGSSNSIESYELVFDSVTARGINDKTHLSSLEGFMTFDTFDKGKSNLKLELKECRILVDEVPFNCGFGKARTTSSGDSGSKDSLVIIAFLEDDVLEEVHSTLKISLNADSPIREIDGSIQVSILEPQSKISGMWFLEGKGTLSKIVSPTDDTTDDTTGNEISVALTENIGLTGN